MCADPREATSHVWDPGRVPRDRLAEAVGSGCDASEPPFSVRREGRECKLLRYVRADTPSTAG
eukprot:759140-Hanusia_phi.AAC.3